MTGGQGKLYMVIIGVLIMGILVERHDDAGDQRVFAKVCTRHGLIAAVAFRTALLRRSGKKKSLNKAARASGQPPVQANSRRDINYEEIRDQSNYTRCDRVFIDGRKFALPPFVTWTYDELKTKTTRIRRIKDGCLAEKRTLRISAAGISTERPFDDYPPKWELSRSQIQQDLMRKKLLTARRDRLHPYHFHWKSRKILLSTGRRACWSSGATIRVKMEKTSIRRSPFARVDGPTSGGGIEDPKSVREKYFSLPMGAIPYVLGGGGKCLIGEVSHWHDDNVDNRFYEETRGYPTIKKKMGAILYPLFSDLPQYPQKVKAHGVGRFWGRQYIYILLDSKGHQ